MRIGVAFDTARLRQDLAREQDRVLRATRRAVYELAHRSVAEIKAEMRQVFDRPTPWVLNGVYVAPRRDENSAEVAWKPGGGSKAIPAEKILRAQVEGGARRQKRFERLLGLPANRIAVPGKWAELDAYGNLKAGQIVKILSDLRLFGEVGYLANRRNRSRGRRRRETYFMIPPGSEHPQLWPGIYRYANDMGGAPLLVIAFVRAANYRARLNPAAVIRRTVARDAGQVWNLALTRQLPFRR
jgi:hypothetical protein